MSPSPENEPFPAEILEWYTNAYRESDRLTGGLGQIELTLTREHILHHLCAPPAVVYDIGGGTGVHSFWLAGLGYEVHLLDIVPLHIEQAARTQAEPGMPRLASLRVGDARQLDFPDQSADAVLLFGPLYHLTARADRLAALVEARRVLRPGGMLFAYALNRYASLMVGLRFGWLWDADYLRMVRAELASGQHRKPENWRVLTTAFFHHPDDLRGELEEAGFHCQSIVGVQGPGWLTPDFDENLKDEARREIILEVARLVQNEPALSPHILAVAIK